MGEHKKFTFRTSVFEMCVLNIKKNQPFRSSGFKVFGDKQEGGAPINEQNIHRQNNFLSLLENVAI